MNDATRDLMHRTIDGEATDAEKERLRAILDSDPAARMEWEELGTLCRALERVQIVEPPESWKQELMAQVRERAAKRGATPARSWPAEWVQSIVAALRPRWSPSTGFAFVAGAVAGIALFAALGPWRHSMDAVDGRAAPGTLLRSGNIEAGRLVGEAQIDLENVQVRASTRSTGRLARVEVDAQSRGQTGLEVDFDPALLRLKGFDHEATNPGPVEIAAGRVRIQHEGQGRYWLWFEGSPEGALEVRIRVRSADHVLERSLEVLRDST